MALATILRSSLFSPEEWTTNTLNENLIQGNDCYNLIRNSTNTSDAFAIPASGYLLVRNFDCIKNAIQMYGSTFGISYALDPEIYGDLRQNRSNNGLHSLFNGLATLFHKHDYGIVISNSESFAVMKKNNYFYFADSHSCGPKGAGAQNGTACIIQCSTIDELTRICKRNAICKMSLYKNCDLNEYAIMQLNSYTIDHIDIDFIQHNFSEDYNCQSQNKNIGSNTSGN